MGREPEKDVEEPKSTAGMNPFKQQWRIENEDSDNDESQRALLERPQLLSQGTSSRSKSRPSVSSHKSIKFAVALLIGVALGFAAFSRLQTGAVDFTQTVSATRQVQQHAVVAMEGVKGNAVVSRVPSDAFQLRLMTFNLRYGTAIDGANSWQYRRAHAADIINRYVPVVFGTQEGLEQQLSELQSMLSRPYQRFGEAREKNGEHTQIFYDTTVVERLAGGTFWLSETPYVESKGWDGSCKRVATWCRFRLLATGQEFYHVNTHLDNAGKIARYEGAKVIWHEMQKIITGAPSSSPSSLPLFMTGDFNTFRPSNVYQFLTTDDDGPLLQDTWQSAAHQIGNISCSFHEFLGPKFDEKPHHDWNDPSMDPLNHFAANHIDFILTRPALPVLSTEVVTEVWDGRYPSDHYPVVSTILFPSPMELPPPPSYTEA